MSNPVDQDQNELQQFQSRLQYESTSGHVGRESSMVVEKSAYEPSDARSGSPILPMQFARDSSDSLSLPNQPRVRPSLPRTAGSSAYPMKHQRQHTDEVLRALRGYRLNLDTEREAKVSGNTYGMVTARGNTLVHRGNVLDFSRPKPILKVHEYTEVNIDSQHHVMHAGNVSGGAPLASATEVLYDGKQATLADQPIVPEYLRSGQPGHSRGHEPGNKQGEASSDLQVEPKRSSTKTAERGRRLGRRPSSTVPLPDPEAPVRELFSLQSSVPPTPRSRNAYSGSRATTNTASNSSLSTAGTCVVNTTTIIMAMVALVFAILGYKVGVASAQSGDRALKLSMWEDCIEHSDILANSATCKKLLDQGFDAIVTSRGGSGSFRGRRGLEYVRNSCPCCHSELGVD